MLVKLDKGKLTTKPIAGTENVHNARSEIVQELLNDEKENAEHIML